MVNKMTVVDVIQLFFSFLHQFQSAIHYASFTRTYIVCQIVYLIWACCIANNFIRFTFLFLVLTDDWASLVRCASLYLTTLSLSVSFWVIANVSSFVCASLLLSAFSSDAFSSISVYCAFPTEPGSLILFCSQEELSSFLAIAVSIRGLKSLLPFLNDVRGVFYRLPLQWHWGC